MTHKRLPIRDRVRELRRVRGGDLVPHPRNWRTHPEAQRQALCGVLAEIGYADALLARELPDGRLQLIDGHLRAESTPDTLVPVLVLDVTDSEAEQLLLTLDPLAGLATTDTVVLDELLAQVHFEHDEILAALGESFQRATQEVLDRVTVPSPEAGGGPVGIDLSGRSPAGASSDAIPESSPVQAAANSTGATSAVISGTDNSRSANESGPPADARYCVLVQCEDEAEQLELLERLQEEGHTCRALIA